MADALPPQDNGSQFREVLGNIQGILNIPNGELTLGHQMSDKGRRPSGDEEERPYHKRTKGAERRQTVHSPDTSDLSQVLSTLSSLVIRLDRDMSILHHQTSFVLHMSRDSRGAQLLLLKTAEKWREQVAQQKDLPPLRCHLASAMMAEFLDRLQKISSLDQNHATIQNLKQQQVLTEKGEWPFLQWNHRTQQMEQASHKPLSMQAVGRLVEEMVEHLTSTSTIQKFQVMKTRNDTQDVPWLMQLSLRSDSPWQAMTALSQIWNVIGVSCEAHAQFQSRQADQLSPRA